MSSESGIRIEEPVTESPAEAAVDVATRYVAEGHRIAPDLIAIRRDLHAHPEVGLQTVRTQHKVLDALTGLDLEITTGKRLASVTAVLHGGKSGPTVLLRGDMDALPIVEETGLPYASTNGAMHACGHDLHTAGLVGAARILAADRENLQGNVISTRLTNVQALLSPFMWRTAREATLPPVWEPWVPAQCGLRPRSADAAATARARTRP